MTSWALWLPLLWIMIIGSRPVSVWLGGDVQIENVQDYLEGSPLDRNIFLVLILAGVVVLLRRRLNWSSIFSLNRWWFAFFIYCGISLIWSDYPLVGFKRWIKDIGNVIMVLIMLSENDPVQATKAVLARYTYLAIPLSVVFIKFFPEIGRYYSQWTWETAYCGFTLEKNTLGPVVFICGLFLLWDLSQLRMASSRMKMTTDILNRILLLLMVFWLIRLANSATSLVCIILGGSILFLMKFSFAKRFIRYLGTYCLLFVLLVVIIYAFPASLEVFVGILEREMTFTGRTDLWADLLSMPINPILGTGYQSFWLGPFASAIWEQYYWHPNQAHNGYLEIYLNLGLVGECLFIAMIIAAGSKLKKELLFGRSFAILGFSFFFTVLFSNWTEATFNRLCLPWILLIMATLTYPRSLKIGPETMVDSFKRAM